MLKIIQSDSIVTSTIDIDYYVPFTINIGEQKFINENKIYWRMGNFDDSLLEIGIGDKTGVLKSVTLTMTNQVISKNVEFEISEILSGVLVFDISMLNKHLFDYKMDFCVFLAPDGISVTLSSERKVKVEIQIGRVGIGFGFQNELMFIRINELSNDEYRELKESFNI